MIIDAKQWKRRDSYGALNKAANKQYQRTKVLKQCPEAFSKLVTGILGQEPGIERNLPFLLIPLIVTLEDNESKLNENQVPLVSIYEFNAFLQELPNNLQYFKSIEVNKVIPQTKLGNNIV